MFGITYVLGHHGWAQAIISCERDEIAAHVSHLSDGLADFARAARGILRGMSETTFSFQDEPGEHRIRVVRENREVSVSVFWFDDSFSKGATGNLVLYGECEIAEFATACINCLRRVIDEHGETEYRARWGADFPMREYRDLLDFRRSLPSR